TRCSSIEQCFCRRSHPPVETTLVKYPSLDGPGLDLIRFDQIYPGDRHHGHDSLDHHVGQEDRHRHLWIEYPGDCRQTNEYRRVDGNGHCIGCEYPTPLMTFPKTSDP